MIYTWSTFPTGEWAVFHHKSRILLTISASCQGWTSLILVEAEPVYKYDKEVMDQFRNYPWQTHLHHICHTTRGKTHSRWERYLYSLQPHKIPTCSDISFLRLVEHIACFYRDRIRLEYYLPISDKISFAHFEETVSARFLTWPAFSAG